MIRQSINGERQRIKIWIRVVRQYVELIRCAVLLHREVIINCSGRLIDNRRHRGHIVSRIGVSVGAADDRMIDDGCHSGRKRGCDDNGETHLTVFQWIQVAHRKDASIAGRSTRRTDPTKVAGVWRKGRVFGHCLRQNDAQRQLVAGVGVAQRVGDGVASQYATGNPIILAHLQIGAPWHGDGH